MPPRMFILMLLIVILAAALTVLTVHSLGLPFAALGLPALLAALALGLWAARRR